MAAGPSAASRCRECSGAWDWPSNPSRLPPLYPTTGMPCAIHAARPGGRRLDAWTRWSRTHRALPRETVPSSAPWVACSAATRHLDSNKWMLGHALGASGRSASNTHSTSSSSRAGWSTVPGAVPERVRPIRTVMVNSVGFGGNAASVVVSLARPEGGLPAPRRRRGLVVTARSRRVDE